MNPPVIYELESRTLYSAATPQTELVSLLKIAHPNSATLGLTIDNASTGTLPPSTFSEATLADAIQKALYSKGLTETPAKRVALLLVDAANGQSLSTTQINDDNSELRAVLFGAGIPHTRVDPVSDAYIALIDDQQQPDVLQLSADLHRAEIDGDTGGLVDRLTHDLILLSQGPIPPYGDAQDLAVSLAVSLQKYSPGTDGNGHLAYDMQVALGGQVFSDTQFQSATFEVQSILSPLGVATSNLSAIAEQMSTLYLDTGGAQG
jgi:hypothetical protein